MRTASKRWLALLLCVVLAVSILPSPVALAEGGGLDGEFVITAGDATRPEPYLAYCDPNGNWSESYLTLDGPMETLLVFIQGIDVEVLSSADVKTVGSVTVSDSVDGCVYLYPGDPGSFEIQYVRGDATYILSGEVPGGGQTGPEIVASGSCGADGDNLTWTLDDTGLLTISGTGMIASYAFSGNTSLTRVLIPEGVYAIGAFAFSGCTSLTSVTLPASMMYIYGGAFQGCTGLTGVTLPEGLQEISNDAFSGCTSLTGVRIPGSVNSLASGAFSGCTGLTDLQVAAENEEYKSVDNVVFTKNGEELYFYAGGKTGGYEIPAGVTLIRDYAFCGCTGLTSITIPASVTWILDSAFSDCTGLTDVYYAGTEEQWNAVQIFDGNDFNNAAIHYQGSQGPAISAQGTCGADGDNLTWTLDENGLLTVSGQGDMADYNWDTAPWQEHKDQILQVVIMPGVTSVGLNAFMYCNHLFSVALSEGLERISSGAFQGCYQMQTLTIPASVTDLSFDGIPETVQLFFTEGSNSYLQDEDGIVFDVAKTTLYWMPTTISGTYTVPDGVTTIGSRSIGSGVTALILPESVEFLRDYALNNAFELESIVFPEHLTELGERSVSGYWIRKLTVPVCDSIGQAAFQGMGNLEEVILSDGITAISTDMFKECRNLKQVTVPASVSYIGWGAFESTDALSEIRFLHTSSDELQIDPGEEGIFSAAFRRDNPGPLAIFMDQENPNPAVQEFAWEQNGYEVTWHSLDEAFSETLLDEGTGLRFKLVDDGSQTTATILGIEGEHPELVIPPELVHDEIGYPVTAIASYAFQGTYLLSVLLPDTLETIGDGAFGWCEMDGMRNPLLASLTIPRNVSYLGANVYGGHYVVDADNQWYSSDEAGCLYNKDKTELIRFSRFIEGAFEIPEGVVSLGSGALSASSIETLSIPASLQVIPEDDLFGLRMTRLIIDEHNPVFSQDFHGLLLQDNGNGKTLVFAPIGVSGRVVVPEGVTRIAPCAFETNYDGATGLFCVVIPASVTEIGEGAFKNNDELLDIRFEHGPENSITIGNDAFYKGNAEGITTIYVQDPQAITSGISNYWNWDPENPNFSGQHEYVFDSLANAPEIKATEDGILYEITDNAAVITGIDVAVNGSLILPDTIEEKPVTAICRAAFQGRQDITSVVIPAGITEIGEGAFSICGSLTEVSLPQGLTTIGAYAFNECYALTELQIPETVSYIGASAFSGANLRSIVIPEGITRIEEYTFSGCVELESVELPNSLQLICSSAFVRSALSTVTIPASVQNIESNAFLMCSQLKSVEFAGSTVNPQNAHALSRPSHSASSLRAPVRGIGNTSITSFGRGAFAYSGLVGINIPNSVENIETGVFANCEDLTEICVEDGNANYVSDETGALFNVAGTELLAFPGAYTGSYTIPDGVTTVRESAFAGAALTSVVIPASVTAIESGAFSGCNSLTEIHFLHAAESSINIEDWAFSCFSEDGQPLSTAVFVPNKDDVNAGIRDYDWAGDGREVTFRSKVPATVAVYSVNAAGGASVANVTINESAPYYIEDEITVTAPAVGGWSFLGWYTVTGVEGGQVVSYADMVSENLIYTFQLDNEDTKLVAVYRENGNATVHINSINGAEFRVGTSTTIQHGGYNETWTIGSVVEIEAVDADKVLQWQNESSKVIGKGEKLSITVTGNMWIYLAYKAEDADQSYVQFVSDYGQVLAAKAYSASDSIIYPDPPTKFGYIFNGWVFEGTDSPADEASIKALLGTEPNITVKPSYTKDETAFSVTVHYDGVAREPDTYANISVGSGFTVHAPVIDGYVFSCWKNTSDTVLGYYENYFLQVTGDTVLIACYGTEPEEAKPVITMSELSAVTASETVHKVSGTATRNIPDGYTLIEHGILYARDVPNLNEDTFVTENDSVGRYVSNDKARNGTVKLNVKVANDDVIVSLRGYMILQNVSTGNIDTYYTDIAENSFSGIQNQ